MDETQTAKLFRHGRSQAVRLPKEFGMPGKLVGCVGSGAACFGTSIRLLT